jgi:hypothetical protein
MILFKLKCAAEHEFDGWFRDNAAYDRQHARGLIACPDCGTSKVEKALMAPRLGRSRPEPAAAAPVPTEKTLNEAPSPAQLRRALQDMRRHVEAHCDYVGERFAEEARRIHNGESSARGIYGEASESEARSLTEDGIEVARIPWVPPSDA